MKKLTIIIAVLAALFCAYWFMLAGKIKTEINSFISDPESGMIIETAPVKIGGFPLKFKTPSAAISVKGESFFTEDSEPLGQINSAPTQQYPYFFSAQTLSVSAKSYHPTKIRITQSGAASLNYPSNTFWRSAFDVDTGSVDLEFTPAKGGGFKGVALNAQAINLKDYTGPTLDEMATGEPGFAGVDKLSFIFTPNTSYAIKAENFQLNPETVSQLSDIVPANIAHIDVKFYGSVMGANALTFKDDVLGSTLKADGAKLIWGDIDLIADINLAISEGGHSGSVNLAMKEPNVVIDKFIAAGIIPANLQFGMHAMLKAAPKDDAGRQTITLSAKNGHWKWGLIPIWPPSF